MPFQLPTCQVVPMPDNQVSLQIDGEERARWHFDAKYPRPFFYPLIGPSGDHAHGTSGFMTTIARCGGRTRRWMVRITGVKTVAHKSANACGWPIPMATTRRSWPRARAGLTRRSRSARAGNGDLRAAGSGGRMVPMQSTFTPKAAQVTLEQSNFGLFAVRVAAGVASYWGDGEITSSEGAQGEPAIFGQSAAWMDYSGAVAARRNGKRVTVPRASRILIMKPIPAIPRTGTCAKTAGWAPRCAVMNRW